jgi:hypothetical protein
MQALGFLISLLLEVRAHIPNQPSFGSGPVDTSYGTPRVRAVAAFLIKTAFLATLIWLTMRFVMGFL